MSLQNQKDSRRQTSRSRNTELAGEKVNDKDGAPGSEETLATEIATTYDFEVFPKDARMEALLIFWGKYCRNFWELNFREGSSLNGPIALWPCIRMAGRQGLSLQNYCVFGTCLWSNRQWERSRTSAGRATKLGFFLIIPERWRRSTRSSGNARDGCMSRVWNSPLCTRPLLKSSQAKGRSGGLTIWKKRWTSISCDCRTRTATWWAVDTSADGYNSKVFTGRVWNNIKV